MKSINEHSKDGIQFQIKNTTTGLWFVDIKRIKFVDGSFMWTDIYLDYQGDKFFETIEDALDNALSHLNNGFYTEV